MIGGFDGLKYIAAECIYTKRWTQAAVQRNSATNALSNGDVPAITRKALTVEDDAKLIFGTVFSLRRIVRQLGGDDDSFLSYRTGEYKMHYFETPTQLKLVMLTDTRVGNMRTVLHQIWATLYVEYVVKNPLSPIEHPKGVGVSNELFEGGLESFIVSLANQIPRHETDHIPEHNFRSPAISKEMKTRIISTKRVSTATRPQSASEAAWKIDIFYQAAYSKHC
jgi:hypothetical protein